MYMTHFFANPLSIFLSPDFHGEMLNREHYEAVRNLSSFQKYFSLKLEAVPRITAKNLSRYIEKLLETDRNPKALRDLLNDKVCLANTIHTEIVKGHKSLERLMHALEVISKIQSLLLSKSKSKSKKPVPWSDLYILGMSGKLLISPILREILLSIKKISSENMKELFVQLSALEQAIPSLPSILSDLENLTAIHPDPIRSSHQIHHQKALRTKIVAQKVELSAHSLTPSHQDRNYSTLVDRAHMALQNFFQETLITPQSLFLHEILIYDLKSPHRDVFAPKPRAAIERALSSPHDYMGCECCDFDGEDHGTFMGSQPATAVLYQLYLESGSMINMADLWEAFSAVLRTEEAEDEQGEEARVL